MNMENLMTRKMLTLKLSISESTLIRWEKIGMPVIRIGGIVRYDWVEVVKWIELKKFTKEYKKATKDIEY